MALQIDPDIDAQSAGHFADSGAGIVAGIQE
jgi:hypothetical protein